MSGAGTKVRIIHNGSSLLCRTIPGYPGYAVSAYGHLFTQKNKRLEWRPMVVSLNDCLRPSGKPRVPYYFCSLSHKGRPRTFGIHQLILLAFRGPPPDGMECRHLDGNSLNNTLRNLKYGTQTQNAQDRVRQGRSAHSEKSGRAVFTEDEIKEVFRMLNADASYSEIGKRFGVPKTTIQGIASRSNWRYFKTDFRPRGVRVGERSRNAILTEKDVREIRRLAKRKTHNELAKQFGVNCGTISCVVTRRTWKHIA